MESDMKRRRYDDTTKQAIQEAVKQTRSGGGKWADAYDAAKKAGYKGSSGGLYQMIYVKPRGKKRGSKKAASKPVAVVRSSADSIVADIAALVNKAVNDRLATAVAALEAMR